MKLKEVFENVFKKELTKREIIIMLSDVCFNSLKEFGCSTVDEAADTLIAFRDKNYCSNKKMLEIFEASKGRYGLKNKKGVVIVEAFANFIDSVGVFLVGKKCGLIDIQTGEILKKAFADMIWNDGRFRVGKKWGEIDLKTGIITKEAC